jgi:spermidine synthase
MNLLYALSFALIGFAATIGQIIALRELLTVFSGSELGVAVVLAAWLFWTALGSTAGGRISNRFRHPQALFGWLQTASGLVLIGTVLFIRAARGLFHIPAGELVTLHQMLGISFVTVAPYCLITGFLFSLACVVLADRMPAWTRSPGLVYFLEGSGAGLGGLLFSLLLVHRFSAVQIAGGAALCLWLSGSIITHAAGRRRWPRTIVAVALLLCLTALQQQSARLDGMSRQWQWPSFRLLDSQETVYGHIVVLGRGEQRTFFENGLWNFTVPDVRSAEEAVHYALLQHPSPRSVLLIGGGVSSSLAQILRHPGIRNVDYVELDPRLIQMGRNHLAPELTAALDDPRVTVHHRDGRLYLSRTATVYDVVLVNLPEPFTAQLNRFYTREFFRLAAGKLHEHGILSFSASAAEATVGPIQAEYLKLLHRTARSVFPSVVIFPGTTVRYFCAKTPGVLRTDPQILAQRLQQRNLDLHYVQDYYILWDLSPLRQQRLMAVINRAEKTGVNSDLNPRGYFYNLLLWGTQYSPRTKRLFRTLSQRNIWIGLAVGCGVLLTLALALVRASRYRGRLQAGVLYAVAVFGLTEISLEIVIVFAFQVFFGYVYYKVGLLVTFFMMGLALGSLTLSYFPRGKQAQMTTLITVQCLLALLCLAVAVMISSFHGQPAAFYEHFLAREAFTFMSLAAGFMGGTHFPVANRLLLQQRERVGEIAGLIYALDLLGSFLGSLTVGLLLIPVVGILHTLAVLGLVNVTAIVMLFAVRGAAA